MSASRCDCCNVPLTLQESTRKFKVSGMYTDMCTKCLSTIIDTVEVKEGTLQEEDEEDFPDAY